MKNKYLKKIGVKPYLHKSLWKGDDKRYAKYAKEAKKIGADERETWDMTITFAEWLYTRVCLYEEATDNIIDTTYHKFQIGNKEYTQKQAIKKIKKLLKFVLQNYENIDKYEKCLKKTQKAARIWAEILPYMWW